MSLQSLVQLLHARSAMLGDIHPPDDWRSAHKATLFFDLDSQFAQPLMAFVQECTGMLLVAPCTLGMSMAERKHECTLCGSRDKEHQCPFRGGGAQRPPLQQQHKQPPPARQAASAGAAAAARPGAAAHPRVVCPRWLKKKECSHKACPHLHPADWLLASAVVLDPPLCHMWYNTGKCAHPSCLLHTLLSGDREGKASCCQPACLGHRSCLSCLCG